jgi:hypothetical protein
MIIANVDFFMDGGSAQISTDEGEFYVDRRLHTTTPGTVWDKHPDEDGASRRDNIRHCLIASLRTYQETNRDYVEAVAQLIEVLDVAEHWRNRQ